MGNRWKHEDACGQFAKVTIWSWFIKKINGRSNRFMGVFQWSREVHGFCCPSNPCRYQFLFLDIGQSSVFHHSKNEVGEPDAKMRVLEGNKAHFSQSEKHSAPTLQWYPNKKDAVLDEELIWKSSLVQKKAMIFVLNLQILLRSQSSHFY